MDETEEKRMNTTINEMAMKELNLDELETVNGGIYWGGEFMYNPGF